MKPDGAQCQEKNVVYNHVKRHMLKHGINTNRHIKETVLDKNHMIEIIGDDPVLTVVNSKVIRGMMKAARDDVNKTWKPLLQFYVEKVKKEKDEKKKVKNPEKLGEKEEKKAKEESDEESDEEGDEESEVEEDDKVGKEDKKERENAKNLSVPLKGKVEVEEYYLG